MIGQVEDEIVARLATGFAGRLREVDHKPARFDDEELARILTMAPAAYVAFLGWTRGDFALQGAFGVYLVASNASGERARRRGDPATIGAYEMAEVATRLLEGWAPASAAGAIQVRACENLFGAAFEKAGRSVYGLTLWAPLPVLDAPSEGEIATLDRFLTFNAQWDVPPHGNVGPLPPPAPNPDAEDRVLPPQ